MHTLSLSEFRAHASEMLDLVEQGESVRILRHGKPVAELVPVRAEASAQVPRWKRPIARAFFAGKLSLDQIYDQTLAAYVKQRKDDGQSHKTINLGLGIVRRILNLAARSWRDEGGKTWLETPPLITMLPLIGF